MGILASGTKNHCHASIPVRLSPGTMLGQRGVERDIRDNIAVDEDEVAFNVSPFVKIPEEVTNRVALGHADELQELKGEILLSGLHRGEWLM